VCEFSWLINLLTTSLAMNCVKPMLQTAFCIHSLSNSGCAVYTGYVAHLSSIKELWMCQQNEDDLGMIVLC